MHRIGLELAVITAIATLLSSRPVTAQILPPAKKADRVQIVQQPALELAFDHLAVIRWTTTNPGGSDVHFAVIHYGMDPRDLSHIATSPIRRNRAHSEMIFRVRLTGLLPRTTYYYRVMSIESGNTSADVSSPILRFTTPAPGERTVADPPKKSSGHGGESS